MVFLIITLVVLSVGSTTIAPAFAANHAGGNFAESGVSVDVSTEKESYNPGETVTISGVVSPYIPGEDVLLQVVSPRNNIVQIAQIEVDPYNGIFHKDIETSIGGVWKGSGNYVVRAFYFDNKGVTQFSYGLSSVGVKETPLGAEETTQNETEEGIDVTELVGVEDIGENSLLVEGVNVNYTIDGGKIISIVPDIDETSLIIEIRTTSDGELVITLPKDVIDGIFFVLVDGEETNYGEELNDNSSTLTIPFHDGSEQIEIIGTFVIPEFGTIVVLVLAISIIAIIAVTSKSRLSLMPKL